jgi:hypothetical protein
MYAYPCASPRTNALSDKTKQTRLRHGDTRSEWKIEGPDHGGRDRSMPPPRKDAAAPRGDAGGVSDGESAKKEKWEDNVPVADWPTAMWTLISTTLALVAVTAYPPCAWTFPFISLLTVRQFIILHDCSHNSFTPSLVWNTWIGHVRARAWAR